MDRLQEIIASKDPEIEKILPLQDKLRHAALARNDFRSLQAALTFDPTRLGLLAEVKRASPSAGLIAEDFDPFLTAQNYQEHGAQAISVLTDEQWFKGHLSYLPRIRESVSLPLLRKDFIVHPVQVYESVVAGADAILLIVAALEQDKLEELLELATTLQLEVLVEVHNEEELDRALDTDANLIGINNRNLKTFQVDLQTTEDLCEEVPSHITLLSESGIHKPEDAEQIATTGCDAVLVGESLMRSDDLAEHIEALRAPRPVEALQARE